MAETAYINGRKVPIATSMRMSVATHVYPPDEIARRPRARKRAVLEGQMSLLGIGMATPGEEPPAPTASAAMSAEVAPVEPGPATPSHEPDVAAPTRAVAGPSGVEEPSRTAGSETGQEHAAASAEQPKPEPRAEVRQASDASVSALRPPAAPAASVEPMDAETSAASIAPPELRTPLERTNDNIAAIEVLHALEAESREATAEERAILRRYTGWGGQQQAFDENLKPGTPWAEAAARLREVLSDEEYADARESTLTAFYTPEPVADAMLRFLLESGGLRKTNESDGVHVLEPGCGAGRFMGAFDSLDPDEPLKLAQTPLAFHGVELDSLSARIASAAYSSFADVVHGALEECRVSEGSFDAALGNVPFSDVVRLDFEGVGTVPLHDWFVMESVRALRPGGLTALVTSRYTMDKRAGRVREWLADNADLVAAVRLPGEVFVSEMADGPDVDVLVLRRKGAQHDDADVIGPTREWLDTSDVELLGGRVNDYFLRHPEAVVGTISAESGPWGLHPKVTPPASLPEDKSRWAAEMAETLSESLRDQARSHSSLMSLAEAAQFMGPRAEEPMVLAPPANSRLSEYVLAPDGVVWFGDVEVQPVDLGEKDMARLAAMVRLSDETLALLDLERSPEADDEDVEAGIADLAAHYDAFVAQYGPLHDKKNVKLWEGNGNDYKLSTLLGLEVVGPKGEVLERGGMLTTRVQTPRAPMPDRVDDPLDALAVSIDRTGGVDAALVARLLGAEEGEVETLLGGAVVRDPESGELVLASTYLSGDLAGKIDRVDALIDEAANGARRRAVERWREECGFAETVGNMRKDAEQDVAFLRRLGVWASSTDPLGSATYVENTTNEWSLLRKGIHPGRDCIPAFLDDLQPGHDDLAHLQLWNQVRPKPRNSNSGPELLKRNFAALALLAARDDVDGEAFYEVVIGVLAEGGYVPDALALCGKATHLRQPAPANYIAAQLDWLCPGLDAASRYWGVPGALADSNTYRDEQLRLDSSRRELAKDLRSDVPLLEYLASTPMALWSPESLADFRAARAAAMARVPEPDGARLASLESVRARLEDALPERLTAAEVTPTLGAPWIPPSVVHRFACEVFECEEAVRRGDRTLEVSFSAETGSWSVNSASKSEYGGDIKKAVAASYGTDERSPFAVLQAVLNKTPMEVKRPSDDDPEKKVRDPEATAAAWAAYHAVEDAFAKWVFKDEQRRDMLVERYNRRMNSCVPCRYDGSHFSFPDMNAGVKLRPYQKDAVARILQSSEGVLVGHAVGAGKTYTGVAAAHEARRLGKAAKPMIVVPNHLTEQWAADFLELYPGSRVLCMGSADMRSADAVRRFWARAKTGDWDAIVVGQSRFDRLMLSPEHMEAFYKGRVEELTDSIEEAKLKSARGGKNFTVKQLEKIRRQAEGKLREARRKIEKGTEAGVSFDEIGVDFLVVDEAHYYKNLPIATSMSIPGLTGAASAKCDSLLAKCDYLREQGRGGNIVFLTGTPVSNTMAELYNMERYLAPGLLESQGVSSFSAWANTFGRITESVEVKPEGTGFQVKQRFSRFHNLPELMNSFHCFADVMTADELGLEVPKLVEERVAVRADWTQKELVAELGERAELIREGCVLPEVDNLLKITSEGRKIAIDPKLLRPDDPDVEPLARGKIAECAARVAEVWRETEEQRGAQLVFCDTSTPASKTWNAYDDLKRRLVEDEGVPADQIAFVHDAGDNPKRREELFARVNRGEVRVLVGSTQKLGTGTNVQERLAATHDLDCPWRPADLEQRLGRVVRQGNSFDEVRNFRYVTKGTFDSYLYQTVERKQRFISQVLTNKSPQREFDDLDEVVLGFAEIKALATGDPNVQRRMEIENEIGQLKLQKSAEGKRTAETEKKAAAKRAALKVHEAVLPALAEDEEAFRAAAEAAKADKAMEGPHAAGFVGGRACLDTEELDKELRGAVGAVARAGGLDRRVPVGVFRGLEVVAWQEAMFDKGGDQVIGYGSYLGLAAPGSGRVFAEGKPLDPGTPGACVGRLRSLAKRGCNQAHDRRKLVERLRGELSDLEDALSLESGLDERIFRLEMELRGLSSQFEELDGALEASVVDSSRERGAGADADAVEVEPVEAFGRNDALRRVEDAEAEEAAHVVESEAGPIEFHDGFAFGDIGSFFDFNDGCRPRREAFDGIQTFVLGHEEVADALANRKLPKGKTSSAPRR